MVAHPIAWAMTDPERLLLLAAIERLSKEDSISDAQLGEWARLLFKNFSLAQEAEELEILLARLRPLQ